MPNNLVLIRHGHSEGNLVSDKSKQGDDSFYTPDFRERPNLGLSAKKLFSQNYPIVKSRL